MTSLLSTTSRVTGKSACAVALACTLAACSSGGRAAAGASSAAASAGASADLTGTRVGLLVRVQAKSGKEGDLSDLLKGGAAVVQEEPATTFWFAFQVNGSTFGIFDGFPDDAGRDAHLNGKVAAALNQKGPELFAQAPTFEKVDILARKLQPNPVTVGIVARMDAKPGKEGEVQAFLEGAKALVDQEPATTTWFAFRIGPGTFGIFDAFADDAGRQAHLDGKVASALNEKAAELFTQAPTIEKVDILASKLPPAPVAER